MNATFSNSPDAAQRTVPRGGIAGNVGAMHEVGAQAMTTEEIAARSGVSKATIYKWWPTKYGVAVEAFLSEMMAQSPDPDTGSAQEDFRNVLRGMTQVYSGPTGRVFAQLVGEGQSDPFVQSELREHLVAPRRELIRAIWDRGVARGQLRTDVDLEAAFDLLFGPLLYRLLIGHAPSTRRGSTRSSTRRCAASRPVTEITRICGTQRD